MESPATGAGSSAVHTPSLLPVDSLPPQWSQPSPVELDPPVLLPAVALHVEEVSPASTVEDSSVREGEDIPPDLFE